jgi:hypothetical protein
MNVHDQYSSRLEEQHCPRIVQGRLSVPPALLLRYVTPVTVTEILKMTMTNAERQAAWRARRKTAGQPPILDRVTQLELELTKLKIRIERLEQRVKNQARRRSTESSLEPSEVARNAFQVPEVHPNRNRFRPPSFANRLRSKNRPHPNHCSLSLAYLARAENPVRIVTERIAPSQFSHRNSRSHRVPLLQQWNTRNG